MRFHHPRSLDFDSPDFQALASRVEALFPGSSIQRDLDQLTSAFFSAEPDEELERSTPWTYTEEAQIDELILPQKSPTKRIEIPELESDLLGQKISHKQFAKATQQYMIRFQNRYPTFKIDDFCAEIGITRSYYYKIIRCERRPTRDTAIAMAIAFGLDQGQTQDYLLLLGELLNPELKRDWLILEAIWRDFSIADTNQLLMHFDSSPIVNLE